MSGYFIAGAVAALFIVFLGYRAYKSKQRESGGGSGGGSNTNQHHK